MVGRALVRPILAGAAPPPRTALAARMLALLTREATPATFAHAAGAAPPRRNSGSEAAVGEVERGQLAARDGSGAPSAMRATSLKVTDLPRSCDILPRGT
jgi:hypothetical protein